MYVFYLSDVMLPVAPGQLQLKIKNQNKTVNLINDGEVNQLKQAGLTEVSFKASLPNAKYPFARYKDGFKPAVFYLDHIEKLKIGNQSFQFIVSRSMPAGKILFDTNMKVSLEDYKIVEDAGDNFDVMVDVSLKQFRPYGTKIVEIKPPTPAQPKPQATTEKPREGDASKISIGSTVTANGRVHRDSYGQGPGKTLSNYKGKVNFINEKGSHPYHVTTMNGGWLGWMLKSNVVGVG